MNACHDFRRRLEALLASSAPPAARRELGWHEHLLGCADCRALLEGEQALELLLESLPRPTLPPFLTQRVLVRLRADPGLDPELRLDALLDLDLSPGTPPGLAQRVQAGVLAQQAAALERLLDEAGAVQVPEGLAARVQAALGLRREAALDALLDAAAPVALPADLAQRVHAGLEHELRLERWRRRTRRVTFLLSRGLAAALLAALALFVSDRFERETTTEPEAGQRTARADLPDEGLLRALPALELWGLLEAGAESGDPSILVGTSLDDADLALSELRDPGLDASFWPGGPR